MTATKRQIRQLRANAAQLIKLADELEAALDQPEQSDESLMFAPPRLSPALERELLIDRVELEYGNRRRRRNFLDADLFGEPAWDILLDLFAARLKDQTISVTSACIAGDVPPTTSLRWLRQLECVGLVERIDNPHDQRSSWVRLTDKGYGAIKDYFESALSQADRMRRSFEERIILAYERARS
ncbi:MarR family transcriptional regulator [Novosphingobium ginsenosidimutans]|uniref:MarR family transcriptional regulator n=1 Tax=Novosphingobium ginsenosidimutans TaxID=1176536 RepID=A0A5B8S555_9SPHN|nr:MarR family transcriptional regulator [Novosphingobium ginsenosidimutans]QEA16533.1 MarR family transcriptional regulator [Novosphingobium ginsenosidimutans]